MKPFNILGYPIIGLALASTCFGIAQIQTNHQLEAIQKQISQLECKQITIAREDND
jgi:hypothetical protein